jgi:hypothetical protein
LKLIRNKLGDYDKFLTFDFQKIQMTSYIRDIDFNEESTTSNFDYLLLPIDKIDLYKENWNKFQEASQKLFKVSIEDYVNLLNQNNGIYIFFDMIVNKIFSKLNKDNYIEDNQDSFNKFSSWVLSILSEINITKEEKTY